MLGMRPNPPWVNAGEKSTGEVILYANPQTGGRPQARLSCQDTKRREQREQSQTLHRRVSGNWSFRLTNSCPFEQITPDRFVGSSVMILVTSSPTSPLPL